MDTTRTSVGVVLSVGEAIGEAGSVRSDELYARFCHALTLNEYNAVVTALKRTGCVTESDNRLTWTGARQP